MEEKEQVLEEAVRRIETGAAPTDNADLEFDKIEKNKVREQMERDERKQRKDLEQQMPINGVKTTAIPRFNSYIPPDICNKQIILFMYFQRSLNHMVCSLHSSQTSLALKCDILGNQKKEKQNIDCFTILLFYYKN